MKVYGPYTRKDGRAVVIHYDGTTRRTQSYPRYLMEEFLGRDLNEWEHVDHISNDCTDNRIENLQILTPAENTRKSAKGAEMALFNCPVCALDFYYSMRQYRSNQLTQGKAGPYCSRQCAGKAHN